MAKRSSSFIGRDTNASGGGGGGGGGYALRYLKAKRGFFFDLFVILPIPQVKPLFFFSFSYINNH